MTMKNKTAFLTATWFKTGLIPSFLPMEMGGTYGSFFALFLCVPAIFVARSIGNVLGGTDYGTIIGMILYSIVVVVIFILGLKSVPIAEKLLGLRKDHKGKIRDHDQNCIVIDEVLGMLIAYIPLMSATTQLRWEFSLCINIKIKEPSKVEP